MSRAKWISIIIAILVIISIGYFAMQYQKTRINPDKFLINTSHLIFLSPHSDDIILTFGGLLLNQHGFPEQEKEYMIFFNLSDYAANTLPVSINDKIQHVTVLRYQEDMSALSDAFNGVENYTHRTYGLKDAILRDHVFQKDKNFLDFTLEDRQLFNKMIEIVSPILQQTDCTIFLPSAVGSHIDHFILREAVIRAAYQLNDKVGCNIYFGEDQPYTGVDLEKSQQELDAFARRLQLEAQVYPIDVDKKVKLFASHYHSQYKEAYSEAIKKRAEQMGGEQIYYWPKEKYNAAKTDLSCQQFYCQLTH